MMIMQKEPQNNQNNQKDLIKQNKALWNNLLINKALTNLE